MLDIFPGVTAPKGDRARSILGKAFEEYYKNWNPDRDQASDMVRARYTSNSNYGITLFNQGRFEVGSLLGVLANTIPSAFFMLIHLYSDPVLLKDVREELESFSVTASRNTKTFHVMTSREKSELLNSTWQEVLRHHALGASSRFVREDTVLEGKYLLKKNMVVQMPMAVMHADPTTWGEGTHVFDARRFLKQGNRKIPSAAYRPFGGGASMCPGRHFVALEIVTLTAWLILQFDMSPSKGDWFIPEQSQESLSTVVFPPARDITVKLAKRQGYENVEWNYTVD
jgi:cytochrome P450